MPKAAARISTSVPVAKASEKASENSETSQLVTVALFSGIGLLISLVAVIFGVQGAWF
ncbi:hypothetical protein IC762_20920 [Bradyrhizobium genosp. L]|uniref:hypothetical protein n=1 Tax=Bradyrhizobium genosp. L TaxID=83637 RepID=UPI0018A26CB8|nr:hypothetical protein [Bradyrhizobium genosp. L]QPF82234.1 hypothetical protein IC762_20920 [Bradyrhizobium genosp. L]